MYAPWCGHCKSLEPVFESVALAFANEPRVVIAKLDGTKNDFDLHPVQGFPTLLFFPANSKTPRPVQGRDARTLINAVVSNSAFQNLNVDADALPKSGVVPQALAAMFPALEEGVLALQSYVMYGPITAFHFVAGAIVMLFGFAVVMLRSGAPTPTNSAPAAAPAARAQAPTETTTTAAPVSTSEPLSSSGVAAAASDTSAASTGSTGSDEAGSAGLVQRKVATDDAAAAPAAAATSPKKKTSKGATKKDA